MVTEDYVSFETAKLLKEKGFDEFCSHYYGPLTDTDNEYKFEKFFSSILNSGLIDDAYTAPTLQMAMKWLREVHNIFIAINMIPDTIQKHYFFKLYLGGKIYNFPLEYSVEFYTIYEEAAEAAIKYCLENLI